LERGKETTSIRLLLLSLVTATPHRKPVVEKLRLRATRERNRYHANRRDLRDREKCCRYQPSPHALAGHLKQPV
jgi:hypothetical protein